MIESLSEWLAILSFNQRLVDQGLDLLAFCRRQPGLIFGDHCGPHLRHLVEHYQALLLGVSVAAPGAAVTVAYDRRSRDRELEARPILMRRRLLALQGELGALADQRPDRPCAVELCGGIDGEEVWVTPSTLARELLFLASHTTHHYALIRSQLAQQGHRLDARFGKAPATVRDEDSREHAA